VNVDGFSFILSGDSSDKFVYEKIGKEIQEDAFASFQTFFYENEFFTFPFNKLYVINNTPRFTFIPSGVFEKQDSEKYINFNFSPDNSKTLYQHLKNPDITILHCIREDIYDFFVRSTENPIFIHHLSSLITYFQSKPLMGGRNKMILNIRQDKMDVLCYSHSDFILGNQFQSGITEDMIYYILFIWKQLKFNQMQDFVYISDFGRNPKLKDTLKEYIKNVVMLDKPEVALFEFPYPD
jgi:hypothetical protein